MKRRIIVISLAMAAGLTQPAPLAQAADATRVLVVGDSISQGVGGDWTWRNWLWREVQRQHAAVDFVGPDTQVTQGYGTRYERSWGWDSAHDARAGAAIDYHQSRIQAVLQQYAPQVVIVELGLNDLLQGDTAATVTAQLQQFLGTIWQTQPNARIVLVEIPNTANAARDAASAQVNQAMATWARGRHVTIAHVRTGEGSGTLTWDPARFTVDDLHPNATGQTLYAHRIAQALHRLLVLPDTVSGVYHERTWSPDLRPAVAAQTRAVRVSWQTATTEVDVTGVSVMVDGRSATGWIRTPTRGDTQDVTIALAAGSHTVQLLGRRGRMVSSPGTAITVKIT